MYSRKRTVLSFWEEKGNVRGSCREDYKSPTLGNNNLQPPDIMRLILKFGNTVKACVHLHSLPPTFDS